MGSSVLEGHTVVVDLGFGDAGKGTVVDWLCANGGHRAVVRFNGGAQAAHNVVTPDGRHHTFAQFSSGTFVPGVVTHLSRFMMVDPLALAAEADHLARVGAGDALERLTVDADALVTTPYHRAANRARERARGAGRHGSCGMGVGETAAYALAFSHLAPRAADCADPVRMRRLLTRLRTALETELGPLDVPPVDDCAAVFAAFAEQVSIVDGAAWMRRLLGRGPVVFEGAQGVLLDEWHGLHPYTTWSTTTAANARTLLGEAGRADGGAVVGVVRTYTPRHGPGPLPTEDPALLAALGEAHNSAGRWQGAFRTGHFDAVLHRYAVAATGGVDAVALTHTDAPHRAGLGMCRAYDTEQGRCEALPGAVVGDLAAQERLTRRLADVRPVIDEVDPRAWPEAVAAELGAPTVLASFGPSRRDKERLGVPAPV